MKTKMLSGFEAKVASIVLKHKKHTNRFKMGLGGWGDTSFMINRIREELWKESERYAEKKSVKKSIIKAALSKIDLCYRLFILALPFNIEEVLSFGIRGQL